MRDPESTRHRGDTNVRDEVSPYGKREAERQRQREEDWERLRSQDWSAVPCPALCSECKAGKGESEMSWLSESSSDHPADVFIHQAMFVLDGFCVQCKMRSVLDE